MYDTLPEGKRNNSARSYTPWYSTTIFRTLAKNASNENGRLRLIGKKNRESIYTEVSEDASILK